MKNSTATILIFLSVGVFYTFTMAQYDEVKGLSTVADEYKNVLQDASEIVELRDRLLIDYEKFPKVEIDRLNKILPDDIDTVKLAFDLDIMASRYGISITSISVETEADENADLIEFSEYGSVYEKATVSFSFVSNYLNLMSLLADLEKSLRIMDIKAISFQTSESGLYEYNVSVETYWLK